MLRTCELRALVSAMSVSQHLALHSCYSWLTQLLSALRPLSVASSSANLNSNGSNAPNSNSNSNRNVLQLGATTQSATTGSEPAAAVESKAATEEANSTQDNTSAGSTAAPAKQIRILKPQGPREASKPRSVVKVQYSRGRSSSEQKRSSSGCEVNVVAAAIDGATNADTSTAEASHSEPHPGL